MDLSPPFFVYIFPTTNYIDLHNHIFLHIPSCLPSSNFQIFLETMASCNMPLLLSFISMIFLSTIAPSMGSCSTRFTNNRAFASCLELPTLSSSLHLTYTAPNATLSIAFVAPPAAPAGWVAWGINPSRPAMVGTRALLAYRSSNGSIVAGTYNITNFNVVPSPIDYPVSGLAAEESGSNFVIFATLQLPAGTTTTNHVWQVGSAMRREGSPEAHAMRRANLIAVGNIDFVRGTAGPSSPAPSPIPPVTPGGPSNAGFHAVAASWSLLLVGLLHLLH